MPYAIEIKNLTELRDAFAKAPQMIAPELERATQEAGKLILAAEKEEVPIKTGALRRSITLDYYPISVSIYPTVNYALPVHEGSRAHVILPKTAKALAFKIGGKMVFVRRVNHPGNKPNQFVPRTIARTEGQINQLFNQVLQNIINFLAK